MNRETGEDSHPRRPVYIVVTWPRLAVLIAALLVMAFAAPLLVVDSQHSDGERKIFRRTSTVKPGGGKVLTAVGAWGTLQVEPIVIEPPRAFFLYTYTVPPRRWVLPDIPPSALVQALSAENVSASVIKALGPLAQAGERGVGTVLAPPDDLVSALSPKDRAALYELLGRYPVNEFQARPFYFRGKAVEDWLSGGELPRDLVRRIESLVYRRRDLMLFSDLDLVWGMLTAPPQRTRLLRILSRVNALSLRLVVTPENDIERLTDYWGQGGRQDLVEPILESSRATADEPLDVLYLLPAFARTRLNSYVNPTQAEDEHSRDCHWTTFNFFNQDPDSRFSSPDECVKEILANYAPVRGDLKMGDAVCLTTEEGNLVHTCVYIAADIVFTKNGAGTSSPFIMEELEGVVENYRRLGATQVRYYRKKTETGH